MRIAAQVQKTPDGLPDRDWMEARLTKVTGSNMARAMKKLSRASNGKKAGDWSADHGNYVSEIAWEIITGKPTEHYVSKAMDAGTMYEPDARFAYSDFRWGSPVAVQETGFVLHPTLDYIGASPDGLTPDGGILEIKVPLPLNHRKYIQANEIPEDYLPQMYCEMLCCESEYGDFVSYCPEDADPFLPEEFRLFIKRTTDDDDRRFSEYLGLKETLTRRQLWDLMEEAAMVTMEQAVRLAKELAERYPRTVKPVKPMPEVSGAPINASDDDLGYLDAIDLTP